jgi:formate hydrogenlyase subunit 3/multisubunit Na+/H+ antiporter MnhD subunit
MTAASAMLVVILLCAAGALAVLPYFRDRRRAGQVSFGVTAAAGALAAAAALSVLATGPGQPLTLWALPAYASALRFHLDGLSAVFVLLIALASTLAALYSIDYMAHYPDYGILRYYPAFLLFVGGMYAIVVITDLMAGFFLCWQVMTLASYALVRFEYKKPESLQAAARYLVWMQVACALIMLGAGLLAQGPHQAAGETLLRYDFEAISHGLPDLLRTRPTLVSLGLACFLLGFGIKAGVWPFGQCWLPAAHPAAPSPVSALLSGVMIKTGVYGLMRSFLWLIPATAAADYPSDAWGAVLAGLGTVTLFIGTTKALGQEQSKRLLAYSSIGQIGYILLALGAAVALLGPGRQDASVLALATVAFSASLFHTVNHGLFKSLLFLNAGTLLVATETQDLNQMGGLMRYLPITGTTALIGAFAIAGVPLLNGFASKWGIFMSLLLGRSVAPYLASCVALAMFTSVLTLALFLKFVGTTFLSRVSARVAARASAHALHEASRSMLAPQLLLAGCCVLFGLAPQIGYRLAHLALRAAPDGLAALLARPDPLPVIGLTGVGYPTSQAVFMPLVVGGAVLLLVAAAAGISCLGGSVRRAAAPWLCGYAPESDQLRYGAHNLYRETLRYFPWVPGSGRGRARLPQDSGSHSAGPGR